MVLNDEQIAAITIALFQHQTTSTGECNCGWSKDVPIPPVTRMLTQQAHQAEVIARVLHLKAINLQPLH